MPSDPKLVQAVFLKAAEVLPEDRDTLLDRECAGDTELRRCVEALLVSHDAPDSFLDRPFVPRLSATVELLTEEQTGTRIGPYQLHQKLGEGGMGAVWIAEQREPVKRHVALKLVKPGLDSAQVLARFEHERQALALMEHDNIARILDAGVDDRGRPYFVMELVTGVPVTTYCDELNLSVRDRLALFIPICRAVQHAHLKGIVHRDIKPANVLVSIQDGRPVPKVIDFGIAKALTPNLADASVFTAVGAVVGTVRYMSPEQAEPSPLDVDTRADVYGLGVLLYELLTGTTPLDETQLQGVAFAETLRMVREVDPPPPSVRLSEVRSARSAPNSALRAPSSQELDWIVMKCLEKDRTRRYDAVTGLARDVERYLADEPVEAGPPSVAYRVRKFVRRNRGRVIAGTAVLAVLMLGLVGTTSGMVWALREQAKAERRLTQVETGADILGSVFENIDPQAVDKEGESLQVILGRRLDHAAAKLDADAVGDPLTVARLQHALGTSYLGLGYPKKTIHLLVRARQTRETHLGPRHPATLVTANNLACAYRDAGDLKAAVTLFEETLPLRREELGPTAPHTLITMNNLAVAYRDYGRPKDALRLSQEVYEIMTAIHSATHEDTLLAKSTLATMHKEAGDLTESFRLLQETLNEQRNLLGVGRAETLRSMSNLAFLYLDANRPKDALPLIEEALRRRRTLLGPP